MSEAKQKLSANLITNVLTIIVSSVAAIWLTPYLINNLGLAVFGVIPLIGSVMEYVFIFTSAITDSVGRFISISIMHNAYNRAVVYFSTAFYSLMWMSAILLSASIGVSFFISSLLNFPEGYEKVCANFFLLTIFATLITVTAAPFRVSTFVSHRFYLVNTVVIIDKFVHIAFVVIMFNLFAPSILFVGFAYIITSLISVICYWHFRNRLTPMLKLNFRIIERKAFSEMSKMSFWTVLDNVGFLFYFSIDLIIIAKVLGVEQAGRYAPVKLIAMMLTRLTDAINKVYSPIAYEYIGQDKRDLLIKQTKRVTKYISIIMALPVGIICGLSTPLLTRWLGPSFADLNTLVWLLVGFNVFSYSVRPLFAMNRGYNRVKYPAIVTFAGGVINIILSYIFVSYTSLGIFGVAIATVICLLLKDVAFAPIYASKLTNTRWSTFYPGPLFGVVLCGITALGGLLISKYYFIATLPRLFMASVIIVVLFMVISYFFALTREDRVFIVSLLKQWRDS